MNKVKIQIFKCLSMRHFEFRVEYSFDVETKSVIATIYELNYILSFGKDFAME